MDYIVFIFSVKKNINVKILQETSTIVGYGQKEYVCFGERIQHNYYQLRHFILIKVNYYQLRNFILTKVNY